MGSRNMERSIRDGNKEFFREVWDYDGLMETGEEDLEYEALVKQLCPNVSATDYINFEAAIAAFEPLINDHKTDWQQK